mmetsp:Transcript_5798/g.16271  ORF Transcript_5798/g.16271 Transcript_5798/m.16271 type:complete len:345 (+) Transcript_5798:118-1152(+)
MYDRQRQTYGNHASNTATAFPNTHCPCCCYPTGAAPGLTLPYPYLLKHLYVPPSYRAIKLSSNHAGRALEAELLGEAQRLLALRRLVPEELVEHGEELAVVVVAELVVVVVARHAAPQPEGHDVVQHPRRVVAGVQLRDEPDEHDVVHRPGDGVRPHDPDARDAADHVVGAVGDVVPDGLAGARRRVRVVPRVQRPEQPRRRVQELVAEEEEEVVEQNRARHLVQHGERRHRLGGQDAAREEVVDHEQRREVPEALVGGALPGVHPGRLRAGLLDAPARPDLRLVDDAPQEQVHLEAGGRKHRLPAVVPEPPLFPQPGPGRRQHRVGLAMVRDERRERHDGEHP